MNAPCKDCKDRHELCHSECELYMQYTEELERARMKRVSEADATIYTVNAILASKKRKGKLFR